MNDLFHRYEELKEIKNILAEKNSFTGTSGNLSIRIHAEPLTFLITASGKDKTKNSPEDFILVNKECQPIYEVNNKPSAETLLHSLIYQQTNAGCVLHIHTIHNNVISDIHAQEGFVTLKGNELIKALNNWNEDAEIQIPIIKNSARIPTLGEDFSTYITGDQGAILIHNHGITVWAATAFEAKKQLEAYEFMFEAALQARLYKTLTY